MLSKILQITFLFGALVAAKQIEGTKINALDRSSDQLLDEPTKVLLNSPLVSQLASKLGISRADSPNTPASSAAAPQGSQCAPLHIIIGRATGEPPGEGTIGGLSNMLKEAAPGASSEAIVYPATLPYNISIPEGVDAMKSAIAKSSQLCPDTKIVLLGYSQGGAVTVDTLCGGGGNMVGPPTPGLTMDEGSLVTAVVIMGDPRFVPGISYNFGTNKKMVGVAERDPKIAVCPTWADRIISYCDINDIRCASGVSLNIHLGYVKEYGLNAAMFIINKLVQSG